MMPAHPGWHFLSQQRAAAVASTTKETDKQRADRYEKALLEQLALGLPERVSYRYIAIAREALGDKAPKA